MSRPTSKQLLPRAAEFIPVNLSFFSQKKKALQDDEQSFEAVSRYGQQGVALHSVFFC